MFTSDRKNNKMWGDEAKEKLMLQKRGMLLEELKLGVWTKEEYQEQLLELNGGGRALTSKCVDS
jgi:hypothetical protein